MECNLVWNHTRDFKIERARFEITSMISDQNCTTRSSITTLLNPFWNRPNTGLGQFKYFIDAELQYAIDQRATFNQVARARYFWLLESSTVSQALTRAPRQPASVKARLHGRFLSQQPDAIFVAAKSRQVSNMFETPAISRRQIALKIAPGLHLRFWSCNFSATKITSGCCDKNRPCKRAFTTSILKSPKYRTWSIHIFYWCSTELVFK